MKRRLLNLLTALSLLLAAATVALWLRSYGCIDDVAYDSPPGGCVERSTFLCSFGGRLMYHWKTRVYPSPRTPEANSREKNWGWSAGSAPMSAEDIALHVRLIEQTFMAGSYVKFQRFGFRLQLCRFEEPDNPEFGVYRDVDVHVPHACLAAVLMLGPLVAAERRLKAIQRTRHGLCPCGYDLRATPGRCPECGSAAGAKVRAA